jgi:uncharacterized membrane protein
MNVKKKLWFDFRIGLICVPLGIWGFVAKMDLGSRTANPLLIGFGAGIGIAFAFYLLVSWLFYKEINEG